MNDLAKRLRIKAGMITMCERIAFGSDTELMHEAADTLEQMLEFKPTHFHIGTGRLYQKLDSIRLKFDDQWFDGISYSNEYGNKFVRVVDDFQASFKEIQPEPSSPACPVQ